MIKALITGVAGQDGSYLAEFLLKKGFIDDIVHRKDLKNRLTLLMKLFVKKWIIILLQLLIMDHNILSL